jgi:hypothetical protein
VSNIAHIARARIGGAADLIAIVGVDIKQSGLPCGSPHLEAVQSRSGDRKMRAHQIIIRQVITIAADAPIVDAANIMLNKHYQRPSRSGSGRKAGRHRLARQLYPT